MLSLPFTKGIVYYPRGVVKARRVRQEILSIGLKNSNPIIVTCILKYCVIQTNGYWEKQTILLMEEDEYVQ